MLYYTLNAEGLISAWSENAEALIPQSDEQVLSTDKKIIYGHDGRLYIDGEEPAPSPEILQDVFVQAIQAHLDTFARTRNYDGIMSAATYATSTVRKFSVEGQYAVEARDLTWAKSYEILDAVLTGRRPMPTIEEVLSELPPLAWPEAQA